MFKQVMIFYTKLGYGESDERFPSYYHFGPGIFGHVQFPFIENFCMHCLNLKLASVIFGFRVIEYIVAIIMSGDDVIILFLIIGIIVII